MYGHPYSVEGETSLGDDQISPSLEARNVPAYQWVEMRVIIPSDLLTSTAGATTVAGDGLDSILQEEEQFANEASDAATARRTGVWWGGGLALVFSIGLGSLVYFGYGRRHSRLRRGGGRSGERFRRA